MIALLLSVATAIVDYLIHPSQFGPFFMEALVTGMGAGVLSFLAALVVRRVRSWRYQRKNV